jgi:hypothetical protein
MAGRAVVAGFDGAVIIYVAERCFCERQIARRGGAITFFSGSSIKSFQSEKKFP